MSKYYIIPMWGYKPNQIKRYLTPIKANSKYNAMLIAISLHENPTDRLFIDRDYENYTTYKECEDPQHPLRSQYSFTGSANHDKMNNNSNDNHETEDTHMDIYDYMYWGDYNARIKELAEKALPEKWSFEDKNDYSILKNYLKYTFNKLQDENKVIETDTYCVFDTGLFSHYYEPIYAYGELNKYPFEDIDKCVPKWYFKGFKDKYELGALDTIEKFPKRADYFSDPSRLVFNWHLEVNKNYKHILDDLNTSQRLPDSVKNSDIPLETLKGVIDTAVQRVIANYKLAVPNYYCNKI